MFFWCSWCLTYTEPHPPLMENHLWSRSSGRGDAKKALFVCDPRRKNYGLVTAPQVHPNAGSSPRQTRRPATRVPSPSRARHGGAAPRRSTHPFTMGILAAKSVRAAHRSAERLYAPGTTSELRFLPTRVRPAGSHSPSRTGSERVNLWSPCEEYKQWVALFCLLAVV